jgi:hypothetical protein
MWLTWRREGWSGGGSLPCSTSPTNRVQLTAKASPASGCFRCKLGDFDKCATDLDNRIATREVEISFLRRLDLRGGFTRGIGRSLYYDLGAQSVTAATFTVQWGAPGVA